MGQITIYLDQTAETKARRAAKKVGKSLSAWFRDLVIEAPADKWPDDVARLFGSVDDAEFCAPARERPKSVDPLN